MLGLPPWVWALLLIVLALGLGARGYIGRFRRMCASVREDLRSLLQQEHPEVQFVEERLGNLILRTPEQPELVWEMADVYAEVARLPNMGADRQARGGIYRRSMAKLLTPPLDEAHPLSLRLHGHYFKPQLIRTADLAGDLISRELPGTELSVIYGVDVPVGGRPLTRADLSALELDEGELYLRALANLGKNFPEQMVTTALDGQGSAIQFGDGMDAARVLLIPQYLGDDQSLIALLPHRDMLLLLPGEMADDPAKLAEGAAMLDDHQHQPLTRTAFRVTRAGVAPVAPG
jgi:hypothetical protein